MSSFTTATRSVDLGTVIVESFQEARPGNVNVQTIPGGDNFYVDLGGRGPQTLTFQALLDGSSTFDSLIACVGQYGTLVVDNVSTHAAILQHVQRQAPNLDGSMYATLTMLLTDA